MRQFGVAALVLVLVAGCDDPSQPAPFPDAADPGPCGFGGTSLPPGPVCNQTCGNGQVDVCYVDRATGGHCANWVPMPEACDGSAGSACVAMGYYGAGTAVCVDCMHIDGACDPCAPADVACAAVPAMPWIVGIAASGSAIAVATTSSVAILDASFSLQATATGIAPLTSAIAGVPGGWLVATTPPSLVAVAADGTLGTPQPLPADAVGPALAYGPGGRALVVWSTQVSTLVWRTTAELVDPSGNVVVAPFDLFDGMYSGPGVATDGTSFYVGQNGSLAKVASDGTFTVLGGFPDGVDTRVTWSGSSGWYIALSDRMAQRFDATGAKLGAAFQITTGRSVGYLADGDDVIGFQDPFPGMGKVSVFRTSPTDTAGSLVDIGIGTAPTVPFFARDGSTILVGWQLDTSIVLARVAPPP